eukprot:TRINITY_DN5715_c0_g1_i3.p1 TRINITY_DN5715_c0_g1~~TRINITY_DN5715_c0_g1_i3.p1  ORF type:complete len:304 (+),score=30.16 TRINITY_DN5715_c0_g1_i3:68-979(+)
MVEGNVDLETIRKGEEHGVLYLQADWSSHENHWHWLRGIFPQFMKNRGLVDAHRAIVSTTCGEELRAERMLTRPIELKLKYGSGERSMLEPTKDKYEVVTWRWLKRKCNAEDESVAKGCIQLFAISMFQVVSSLSLIVSVMMSIEGSWEYDVSLPLMAIGAFGLGSSVIGVCGSITNATTMIQRFWITQMWLLSLVVFFIYTESHHLLSEKCSRSNCLAPSTLTAITSCLLLIGSGYVSVYISTGCLHSLSSRLAMQNHMALFKYFQYYCNGLSTFLFAPLTFPTSSIVTNKTIRTCSPNERK